MFYQDLEIVRVRQSKSRARKEFKRRRIRCRKKIARFKNNGITINHRLLKNYKKFSKIHFSELTNFFAKKDYLNESLAKGRILVPRKLSLVDNFDTTITFLKEYLSSLYLYPYNIILDFSRCKKLELAPLFLIKIFWKEFDEYKDKFDRINYSILPKAFKLVRSGDRDVNRLLYAYGFLKTKDDNGDDDYIFLPMHLRYGNKSRSSFKENVKGRVCKDVRDFLNESLNGVGYKLNKRAENTLDKLISEILNNAEDHSEISRWYVDGVSFQDKKHIGELVELNLSIVNFGYSIFEGIEETKTENFKVYKRLEDYFRQHQSQFKPLLGHSFSREELFTLYALQEGESRLKYEDTSRGNGTMNFLDAFINLGAFGDENPKFKPELNILTGGVSLFCDNIYKPYLKDGKRFLSLNKEKNFDLLPDANYLKSLKGYFPGTIFQIKIFLSKSYINKLKEQSNGKRED